MLRATRILQGSLRLAPRVQPAASLVSRRLQRAPAAAHQPISRSLASAAPNPNTPSSERASVGDTPILGGDAKQVAIGWDGRTWSRFHHIWLRDHCRCEKCFHSVTKQRLQNTFEIPRDITPLRTSAKPEGLEVVWNTSDQHASLYPWAWLKANSYDPPLPERNADISEKILWGSKIAKAPPTVAYEDVMSGDAGVYKWLSNIDKFGFSFISGIPVTPEATEELCLRIGFIRETHYGKFWDFTSNMARGDTAYTTLALGAHTDNTYFTDPCGLQLFHLLEHSGGTGGATLLVDGFYVASLLKELHPAAYRLLSQVPIPAHAAGEPDSFYRPAPVRGYPTLGHDLLTKELVQVRWNNDDRSVMNHLEARLVEEWYDAIRLWNDALRSPESEYWVQLQPGTALVVDNHRVLHGRSAFDGKRRMCGAYIGVDEYKSKLAVLKERIEPDSVARATAAALPDTVVAGRTIWNTTF